MAEKKLGQELEKALEKDTFQYLEKNFKNKKNAFDEAIDLVMEHLNNISQNHILKNVRKDFQKEDKKYINGVFTKYLYNDKDEAVNDIIEELDPQNKGKEAFFMNKIIGKPVKNYNEAVTRVFEQKEKYFHGF